MNSSEHLSQKALSFLDEDWYVRRYPDVAGVDVQRHYLKKGIKENRSPSPLFDAEYYWEIYEDVADANIPAILHYFNNGGREWRKPNAFVDIDSYRDEYGTRVQATDNVTILEDIQKNGIPKDQFSFFNADYYRSKSQVAERDFGKLLNHFFVHGLTKAHSPHPLIQIAQNAVTGELATDYLDFRLLFEENSPDAVCANSSSYRPRVLSSQAWRPGRKSCFTLSA